MNYDWELASKERSGLICSSTFFFEQGDSLKLVENSFNKRLRFREIERFGQNFSEFNLISCVFVMNQKCLDQFWFFMYNFCHLRTVKVS